MIVRGLEGLSPEEIRAEMARGARFVVFDWCVSFVVVTLRRTSEVHFIRAGQSAVLRSLPYTAVSLVLGWWGIPWGPLCTVQSVATNLRGGRDVTPDLLDGDRGAVQLTLAPSPAA